MKRNKSDSKIKIFFSPNFVIKHPCEYIIYILFKLTVCKSTVCVFFLSEALKTNIFFLIKENSTLKL